MDTSGGIWSMVRILAPVPGCCEACREPIARVPVRAWTGTELVRKVTK